jgi:hypothetical protein
MTDHAPVRNENTGKLSASTVNVPLPARSEAPDYAKPVNATKPLEALRVNLADQLKAGPRVTTASGRNVDFWRPVKRHD